MMPKSADESSRKLLPDSVTRAVPTWPPTSCGDSHLRRLLPAWRRQLPMRSSSTMNGPITLSSRLRTREFQRAPRRDSVGRASTARASALSAPATSARPAPYEPPPWKKGMPTHITSIPPTLDYIEGDFTKAYKRLSSPTWPPGESGGLEAGYYMAQIEFSRGQYADVISRGRSLLSENPVPDLCAEINRIVGLSCFKLGEYPQARRYLTQYLGLTADNPFPDALYALGAIALRRP